MARGFAPLRLTFVELSNLEVLFSVSVVMLENDLGVLVHLLVGLGNNKSVFSLASQDQELNSLFLGTFSLTVLSNFQGTIRQLALLSEDSLCTLSVVQVIEVETNDVFPIVGTLICLFSLAVKLLRLLGFGDHLEDVG